MQSVSDVWSMILKKLGEDLSETTIKTWFDDTAAIYMDKENFILHCPNDFKRSNIQDRFLPNIKEKLQDIFSSEMNVQILDNEGLFQFKKNQLNHPPTLMESEEYTFDTFVVGPSNRLACSAAKSVADNPGQSYNPLFIYGNSGLGKTHLLYAIAHAIHKQNPISRIAYIKGDEFINDFIEAIRFGKAGDFRIKYREIDLMLIDDIQFVAGKIETQNEFFHTFNTLYESKRQIVLTSDRPPSEMEQLDERLKTRFEWGLTVDVQPPTLETRIAILKTKGIQLGIPLNNKIAAYIATRITSNVRQLEGTVKKMKAYHEMEGQEINEESAERAIQDMSRSSEFKVDPNDIIAEVCQYFHLNEDQIRGQSRNRDCVNARQIAMYLTQELTELPLKKIGKSFSNRDHTTVIHAIEQVKKRMQQDHSYAGTVKTINTNVLSKKNRPIPCTNLP